MATQKAEDDEIARQKAIADQQRADEA